MKIRRSKCFLCGAELEAVAGAEGIQQHPETEFCEVKYTDPWGISVDVEFSDVPEETPALYEEPDPDVIVFQQFPLVDDVLRQIYTNNGLTFLGGASSGRGWSSMSTFQRCWYLWKKKYIEDKPAYGIIIERPAMAIGTLVHTFLALHYTQLLQTDSPFKALTPMTVYAAARLSANPALVEEGWRVFSAYRLFYTYERIIPIAIEHDLQDPRTRESCRFDLIAFLEEDLGDLRSGTYNFEHKTGARFDRAFLEGWQNDGEVIGQNMLWKRLSLDKYFGELRGTVVNLLGKQKEPKFHRTFVAPDSFRIDSHASDLRTHEALLGFAKATNTWPRSRGNCIGRYGMCDYYDHCAGDTGGSVSCGTDGEEDLIAQLTASVEVDV